MAPQGAIAFTRNMQTAAPALKTFASHGTPAPAPETDTLPPAPPATGTVTGSGGKGQHLALDGNAGTRIGFATFVAVAHLAGLAALAHFGMQRTTPPEIAPIQVALIQAPVAVEPPAAVVPSLPQAPAEPAPPPPEVLEPEPPPPPPPPKPEPKPEPKPKPVPKKPAPKPVVKETPQPTASPTALREPAEPVQQAPAPAAAATTSRSAASAAPPLTQARYDAAYLNNPHPAYPMASRRLREEGKVMLRVLVSRDGHPSQIELRTSSGSSRLDKAAREAVARWRFVPAKRGDAAVESWVLVPIVFKLQGN